MTPENKEDKNKEGYSNEYPYGDATEPYDIWKEEELCNE